MGGVPASKLEELSWLRVSPPLRLLLYANITDWFVCREGLITWGRSVSLRRRRLWQRKFQRISSSVPNYQATIESAFVSTSLPPEKKKENLLLAALRGGLESWGLMLVDLFLSFPLMVQKS